MVNKKLLVACIVLGVVACASLLVMTMTNSPYGLTSVEHTNVEIKKITNTKNISLVGASFVSPDNYLGIIFIPFKISGQMQETPVRFVLIDKESGKTLHTHEYVAKNFSDKPLFPFGIPIIKNSKNKEYIFAINRLNKNDKIEGLALDMSKNISSIHLFDRRELKRNNIGVFISSKVMATLGSVSLWPFLLIMISSAAFPFAVKIFVGLGIVKAIEKQVTIFLWLIQMLTVLTLVLIPKQINDLFYTIWIVFHLSIAYRLKSSSKMHYFWALGLILLSPIFLAFGDDLRAEKAAIFTFFFLTFGVFQEIFVEIKNNFSKKQKYEANTLS